MNYKQLKKIVKAQEKLLVLKDERIKALESDLKMLSTQVAQAQINHQQQEHIRLTLGTANLPCGMYFMY